MTPTPDQKLHRPRRIMVLRLPEASVVDRFGLAFRDDIDDQLGVDTRVAFGTTAEDGSIAFEIYGGETATAVTHLYGERDRWTAVASGRLLEALGVPAEDVLDTFDDET